MLFLLIDPVEAQHGISEINRPKSLPHASLQGLETFRSHCSACHGLGGRGGEHAPDLVTSPEVRARSDRQLFEIITSGIPRAGMPAFNLLLKPDEIRAVVVYLRRVSGKSSPVPIRGDRKLGKALFFGKAGCSSCHMLDGKGGFLGADLSDYGRDHSPTEIRDAILHPSSATTPDQETVSVTTRTGEQWTGIVRSEDNFSIQLLDEQGKFHLLVKSDLASLRREPRSAMPEDYESRLSPAEVDALIAYLATTGALTQSSQTRSVSAGRKLAPTRMDGRRLSVRGQNSLSNTPR